MPPEQRVSRQAMGRRFPAMRVYPGDFCFQQGHARIELGERMAIEALQVKLVSRICTRADPTSGKIIIHHCSAASTGFGLLSTESAAKHRRQWLGRV